MFALYRSQATSAAFTGRVDYSPEDRVGRFQLADHGTLFLDEVGEIPLDLQSKLLRVLQEGEFLGREAEQKHFIHDSARRMGLPQPRLTEGNIRTLTACDWPGNIRELQHVVERAVILGRGQTLQLDLPLRALAASASSLPAPDAVSPVRMPSPPTEDDAPVLTADQLRQLEIGNYRNALKRAGGKVYGSDGAASLLGIPATTLASRLKALGIQHG